MGYRFIAQNGEAAHLRFIRAEGAPIVQDWRSLGLDAVNDNDPDRQAGLDHVGQSALGGGPE
jgi:hypothetical protein